MIFNRPLFQWDVLVTAGAPSVQLSSNFTFVAPSWLTIVSVYAKCSKYPTSGAASTLCPLTVWNMTPQAGAGRIITPFEQMSSSVGITNTLNLAFGPNQGEYRGKFRIGPGSYNSSIFAMDTFVLNDQASLTFQILFENGETPS